jgi:hypothetical protein
VTSASGTIGLMDPCKAAAAGDRQSAREFAFVVAPGEAEEQSADRRIATLGASGL